MLSKQLREMERQASVLENNYSQKTNVMNNNKHTSEIVENFIHQLNNRKRNLFETLDELEVGSEMYNSFQSILNDEINRINKIIKFLNK